MHYRRDFPEVNPASFALAESEFFEGNGSSGRHAISLVDKPGNNNIFGSLLTAGFLN